MGGIKKEMKIRCRQKYCRQTIKMSNKFNSSTKNQNHLNPLSTED
jgi:hypothetical protein